MGRIVGIIAGHPRKQILIRFPRQQVTIFENGLAKSRQQGITAVIDLHPYAGLALHHVVEQFSFVERLARGIRR